jgi:hypothetical protein
MTLPARPRHGSGMHRALQELLNCYWVIARRDYPDLAGPIDVALRRQELVTVLPGVYALPQAADGWRTLATAASLWDQDAVIVGEAAAALTFWPELEPTIVEVAVRRRVSRHPRIRTTRRVIPPELTTRVAHILVARPELTAVDLVPRFGGDAIDTALRSRRATLPAMYRALDLTRGRVGNADRRRLLLDSRDQPWSALERLAHRHLRAAGITRWTANVPITVDGHTFFQDIAMDDCPVSAEFDGKLHLQPALFESDRQRGNYLLLAGRDVLHFTWNMVHDEPDLFVGMMRRAIDRYR